MNSYLYRIVEKTLNIYDIIGFKKISTIKKLNTVKIHLSYHSQINKIILDKLVRDTIM